MWEDEEDNVEVWWRGCTGYLIVDVGMRELWSMGWMYNCVCMIMVSFLIKDLLVDWWIGERWFWDMLVDVDFVSNVIGW